MATIWYFEFVSYFHNIVLETNLFKFETFDQLTLNSLQGINIYNEKEQGRRILEDCQSKAGCVKYLLSEEGLSLGEKISEQNAQTILANYCCGKCNNGESCKSSE